VVVSQEEFKQDDEFECFTRLSKTRGMLKKKLISRIEVGGSKDGGGGPKGHEPGERMRRRA
jgi:hypothetical protein